MRRLRAAALAPAAATPTAATPTAASAARCDAAVRVLELEGGEYAIRISLPPEVTQPDAQLGAVEAAAGTAASRGGGGGDGTRLAAEVDAERRV